MNYSTNRLSKTYLDDSKYLKNCFLAGGAILSSITKQDLKDYDIYPKNINGLFEAIDYGTSNGTIVNLTNQAISFKLNNVKNDKGERIVMQVIVGNYKTAQDIFNSFDFTVCMAAFDFETEEYTFHPDFWPDVASRVIRFNEGTKYPLNSLLRIKKYMAKGYTVSKSQLIKMALTIHKTSDQMRKWEDLETAIGGIYGKHLSLSVDKTLPFTYDNMMKSLDDLDLEAGIGFTLNSDVEDDYEKYNFAIDMIFDIVAYDLKVYHNTDRNLIVIYNRDGFVENVTANTDILMKIIEVFKPYTENPIVIDTDGTGMVFGYKVVKHHKEKENTFVNAIYNSSKKEYVMGEVTREDESPNMFVHMFNKPDLHNRIENYNKAEDKSKSMAVIKVGTRLEEITMNGGTGDFTTKELFTLAIENDIYKRKTQTLTI